MSASNSAIAASLKTFASYARKVQAKTNKQRQYHNLREDPNSIGKCQDTTSPSD